MSPGAERKSVSSPPHLIVILDQQAMGPEWKSWLIHELALSGSSLGTDGTIEERGSLIGFFDFLERQECETLLQEMGIEARARACPWAGPIRGALGWEGLGSLDDLLRSFIPALIQLSRGPVVRMRDAAHHEPVRQVEFALHNLISKFGFEDGSALLERSPSYLEYARSEAQIALVRAGIEAQVTLLETAHNPLRIWGPVTRNGLEVSEEVLREFSMTLWAFDWTCLGEMRLW